MIIYLVRHGQTDWNARKIVQGVTDIPLNETGLAQAARARDLMKDVPIDIIYSSPLVRAYRTAEIIKADAETDVAGINRRVTIYIPEDDEEETYKIVTNIRGDSLEGRITEDSPLGKALKGHRAGEQVTVHVNDSYSYDVVIREVVAVEDDLTDGIRKY